MYWICGHLAYEALPSDWSGACTLGWIKPSFFLLPIQTRQVLNVPLYQPIGQRTKRDTAFSSFPCKEAMAYEDSDTWDSERIVCTYGPATWAEDGSWGYRTPIYMLNRIIRLQAILDLAGQRLDTALNTVAAATDKLRTAVYQNRLALDWILAKEGGVCGKFNLTNCCLQIDEVGQVVKKLTTEIRQLTHNPEQEWKGWNMSWLTSQWPKIGWLKGVLIICAILLLTCMILPCLLPVCFTSVRRMLQGMVDRETTAKVMALYSPLSIDEMAEV